MRSIIAGLVACLTTIVFPQRSGFRPVTKCLNVVAVAESHVWHETASSACAPNYPQNSLCALHKTIS